MLTTEASLERKSVLLMLHKSMDDAETTLSDSAFCTGLAADSRQMCVNNLLTVSLECGVTGNGTHSLKLQVQCHAFA